MYSQSYGKQKASQHAKLKYYCQMCRKQCLDENGWRCHTNSDHHMNMMRKYHEDPQYFIRKFSIEFEEAFLIVLTDNYMDRKVSANHVYMELIKKIDHIHLNGTQWTSLTQFCKHLATLDKVEMEIINEHDAYIKYINKSAAAVKQRKEDEKRKKILTTNNMIDKNIMQQIEKDKLLVTNDKEIPIEPILEQTNISFSLNIKQSNQQQNNTIPVEDDNVKSDRKQWVEEELLKKQTKPNLDKLYNKLKDERVQQQSQQPQIQNSEGTVLPSDTQWIHTGIVVKILDANLHNGQFLNKKAVIQEVIDQYVARIELLTSRKEKILIDQKYLQTVIPKVGGQVMILKEGEHRGKLGVLESVHQDNFSGSVFIEKEDLLLEVAFDLFSKV